MLSKVSGDHAPLETTTCSKRFCRFRDNDFDIKNKEHGRRIWKKFEAIKLQTILAVDGIMGQKRIAQQTISDRMVRSQKFGTT